MSNVWDSIVDIDSLIRWLECVPAKWTVMICFDRRQYNEKRYKYKEVINNDVNLNEN